MSDVILDVIIGRFRQYAVRMQAGREMLCQQFSSFPQLPMTNSKIRINVCIFEHADLRVLKCDSKS